jgi:hypothetical protein
VAAGSNCSTSGSSRGVCDSGVCRSATGTCGGLGYQSGSNCSLSYCTAPYAISYASDCVPCGLEGQRCCTDYYGFCASGLACDFENCTKCGLSGQPCCQGGFCKAGTCSSGTCP